MLTGGASSFESVVLGNVRGELARCPTQHSVAAFGRWLATGPQLMPILIVGGIKLWRQAGAARR
jgi:hypothetical protein